VTAAQRIHIAALEALTAGMLGSFPQHSSGATTIGGRDYALGDTVLERLKADVEPILSSERDTRDTDRCPPPWETEPC